MVLNFNKRRIIRVVVVLLVVTQICYLVKKYRVHEYASIRSSQIYNQYAGSSESLSDSLDSGSFHHNPEAIEDHVDHSEHAHEAAHAAAPEAGHEAAHQGTNAGSNADSKVGSHANHVAEDEKPEEKALNHEEMHHTESNEQNNAHKAESPKKPTEESVAKSDAFKQPDTQKYTETMDLFKSVIHKFFEYPPGIETINPGIRNMKDDTGLFGSGELGASSTILSLYSTITKEEIETVKKTHAKAVAAIPDSYDRASFTGRGIVMVGGGKYFPVVLMAISWIRKTDKVTPIELFMLNESEEEPEYCSDVFPDMNVKCRLLNKIYGNELSSKVKSMYALKPLAILASQFEDIFFMDSDSLPLSDINEIFDWDVYQQKGLIVNSDYWIRAVHPAFYDIVGIKLGGRVRGDPDAAVLEEVDREGAIPYLSNESGQMFIKKSQHFRSLLLATYYNLFGPDCYFPLLMQRNHGEGDKDTYVAAAVVLKEDFYQTQEKPAGFGYWLGPNDFQGLAMVQPNPITAYENDVDGKKLENKYFALHANTIKGNPRIMMASRTDRIYPPFRKTRYFGKLPGLLEKTEHDPELRIYEAMREYTCEWVVKENHIPKDWANFDAKRACHILETHVKYLKEHTDVEFRSESPFWEDII